MKTVIKIRGRAEIGEGDEGFIVPGEIVVDDHDNHPALPITITINGRGGGSHSGIFAHPDPRDLKVGDKIRIKGFGHANNAWEGNMRKNFGEWIVV